MSKANVGDKFIIEVAEVMPGGNTGSPQYRIKGFDKLFFDDKGLKMLEKIDSYEFSSKTFDDGCKFGAEGVWQIANEIMNIPIHERAALFGVSHNRASFKDLSSKFSIYDAIKVYEKWKNEKKTDADRTKAIINQIKIIANEYNYDLIEIKKAVKKMLKDTKLTEQEFLEGIVPEDVTRGN